MRMSRLFVSIVVLSVLLAVLGLTLPAGAAKPPPPSPTPTPVPPPPPPDFPTSCDWIFTGSPVTGGPLAGGAYYMICKPWLGWNGDLVVYAHGYEPNYHTPYTDQGGSFKDLKLGTTSVPQAIQAKGYAFAATNYRYAGLTAEWAMEDMRQTAQEFIKRYGRPRHIYAVGASEGGLVAAKLAETPGTCKSGKRNTPCFDGAMAACGPIGDFVQQTNYLGDFRILWDYYYAPTLIGDLYLPDTPIHANSSLIVPETPTGCSTSGGCTDPWNATWVPRIRTAVGDNSAAALSLVNDLKQIYDPGGPSVFYDPAAETASLQSTAAQVLWYGVFATNNANEVLGGQPFDNNPRAYPVPNPVTERYDADLAAINNLNSKYQTNGKPVVPLMTIHNVGDPVVPFWHERLYKAKADAAGTTASLLQQRSSPAYGHCQFTSDEVTAAFDSLNRRVSTGSW